MTRAVAVAIGAVMAAVLFAPTHPPPATFPALAALLVAAAAGRVSGGRAASWGALVAAAALGGLAVAIRLAAGPAPPPVPAVPDGDGPWHAVVETIAAPRDGQQPATLRFDEPAGLRVAATLPRFPAVQPGDGVTVSGPFREPTDDPYGSYLRRIGVAATVRSRTLEREPRTAPAWDLEPVRRGAADALSRALPEPEAGLAAGILIGLRDRVDRDLAAAFTVAGASHVVAISGWNIAIVAASVAALGGRFARRRRSVLTVAAIVVYVAFVGPTPSVLRAGAMAAVVLLARESGRAGRAVAGLAWAAVAILVVDPSLVRDAGFQLSTLATAGLLAWATPLSAQIDALGRGRLPGWFVENLGVSLAAQAATLPIVLGSFGRLSIVSPAVNLLVIPFVAPAMAAGALALAAGTAVVFGAPAIVATLAGLPAWVCLGWIVGVVRAAAGLPFASVALEPPADLLAAAIATCVVVAAAIPGLRANVRRAVGRGLGNVARRPNNPPTASSRRPAPHRSLGRAERAAILALAASLVGTAIVLVHRPDGRTRITVLDVGQGDGILVEGGRGGRLLVDGGPDPDRLLVALDERLPPWDRRIDAVVLTHPHEDHVAGLALLLQRYRVGRVFEPGMRGPGPGYVAWSTRLAGGGTASGMLATGDRFALDDIGFRVLWPDPGTVPREPPDTGTAINNVSIVLLGEVGGRRFLLAGDIEEEIDPLLLRRGLPSVDVLKVAHHGSRTSSTGPFLDAVRPAVAVASAGAKNTYGHPAPATIERLTDHGARVLRTDRDGTVEISLDADRIAVRASGPRRSAAATSAAVASIGRAALPAAFACGVPARQLARPTAPVARPAAPEAARFAASQARGSGREPALLYHRPDVGSRAGGRRRAAPVPRPPDVVHAPLASRGGDRLVAGDADRSRRDRGRPAARGGGRAPP